MPHPELKDENFLPITAYEFQIPGVKSYLGKLCHMNFYAMEEENDVLPILDSSSYTAPKDREHIQRILAEGKYQGEDQYLPYCPVSVNRAIQAAKENGFIVCYNHPRWSNETIFDYIQYEGFSGFEVFNNNSWVSRGSVNNEWNMEGYDTLLKMGRRVLPYFTDDSHNPDIGNGAYCSAFGGFLMVEAQKLEYASVMNAIKNGKFYASQAPEIYELYIEDNKLCVSTPGAREIKFITAGRLAARYAAEEGETINYGEFELKREIGFVRVEVIDKTGKVATTRGFFEDELI